MTEGERGAPTARESSEGSSKCQETRESLLSGGEETVRYESDAQRRCACDAEKPSSNPGR